MIHLDAGAAARADLEERLGSPEPLDALRSCLRPGDTFVDVGASFGFYATLVGRHLGPRGTVVAFEPGRRHQSLLRLNLAANGILSAEVHPIALGNRPGLVIQAFSGGAVVPFLGDSRVLADHELVEASTLDREIGGRAVHALRVSAAGAEGLVLQGARNVLRARTATVLLTLAPEALELISLMSVADVLGLLEGFGYSFAELSGSTGQPVVVPTREILARARAEAGGRVVVLARPD